MLVFFAFLVGIVFGWLVTWILQNRINDDMVNTNDELERDLAAARRENASLTAELAKAKAALPPEEVEAEETEYDAESLALGDEEPTPVPPVVARDRAEQSAAADEPVVTASDMEESQLEGPTVEQPALVESTGEELRDEETTRQEPAGAGVMIDEDDAKPYDSYEGETFDDRSVASEEDTSTEDTSTEDTHTEETSTEEESVLEVSMEESEATKEAEAEAEADEAEDDQVPGSDTTEPPASNAEEVSDLTRIRGIGPKFAETLYEAGIMNFRDLAMSTPEQLQDIIQPAAWQNVEFEEWIAQANDILYE